MSHIRKTTSVARLPSDEPLEFILSDESIDAYGDQISVAGWDLSDFIRNPIALVQHDPDFPCGKWENVRVERGALRGHLRLAPQGASRRIDEIRALVDADILCATSVGFLPLQSDPLPGKKGVRYIRQLLREVSLVSIPANANALAVKAKSLGISNGTIEKVFGQSKNATLAERQARAKIKVDQLMAVERAKRRARAQARNPADDNFDPFSLVGLSDAERAAVLRAKQEMPYALPTPPDNPWSEPPSLYFGGKPIFGKKNEYGW